MERHISTKERKEKVEQVLVDLGLAKCRNTKIGVPGVVKGISGGEMKRLAFACEVLTNPQLLFCDEPTSGLDSYMANNVAEVLRDIAKKGKTIVCTIHQPSSTVFELFDRVLLMAEGRVAYLGPLDGAERFFERLNLPCPKHHNMAEHFVNVLAVQPSQLLESRKRITEICDAFEGSPDGLEVRRMIDFEKDHGRGTPRIKTELDLRKSSPYRASVWEQFTAVLWRR